MLIYICDSPAKKKIPITEESPSIPYKTKGIDDRPDNLFANNHYGQFVKIENIN